MADPGAIGDGLNPFPINQTVITFSSKAIRKSDNVCGSLTQRFLLMLNLANKPAVRRRMVAAGPPT